MTKEQFIAAINGAIAGQGNQVDISGKLAGILTDLAAGSAPIEVEDIEALTAEQLDSLNVGDKVVKVTGKQKHLYLVTYKGEGAGEGIVLTYNACGYGEAISYDRTESGWAYNSTDVKTYGE
jgi:hypothetical protein